VIDAVDASRRRPIVQVSLNASETTLDSLYRIPI
jgi:hypothetical protein